jgi:uncharacterized protein
MTFMMDHMLIRLGKYLRIAGFDAAWDTELRTHELILRANSERRIFVTCNKRLEFQYPAAKQLVTVRLGDPVEQFQFLVSKLELDVEAGLFSKCVRCNVALSAVADKPAIRERVRPNVYLKYEHFFVCPSCSTVFWKGSHVRNTCRKLNLGPADEMGKASIPDGEATVPPEQENR